MASLSFIIGIIGNVISILRDFSESSEEEINRELQRDSIHNYPVKHKFVVFLWNSQAGRPTCGYCQWCWCHYAIYLCHSVSDLCSQGCKDQVYEIGSHIGCWFSWGSDCTNSPSLPWKFSAYLCGYFVCRIDLRHVCSSSFCHEDGDKDQVCGVHAVFSLIFSIPQWRHLVCLCGACQGLLYWSAKCHRICVGVSPVDPLLSLQKQVRLFSKITRENGRGRLGPPGEKSG